MKNLLKIEGSNPKLYKIFRLKKAANFFAIFFKSHFITLLKIIQKQSRNNERCRFES